MKQDLDKDFWDARYQNEETGWDLGNVSPAIKSYIDQCTDKDISILIPGCGNAYEAAYLLQLGFTNITLIDIAPLLVSRLEAKFQSINNPNIHLICSDFFEHTGKYNLILEQTFFCALLPTQREAYVQKMGELLTTNGKLVGLLFNRNFEAGPPFSGNKKEYETLFTPYFHLKTLEACYNSIPPRAGTELFMIAEKK